MLASAVFPRKCIEKEIFGIQAAEDVLSMTNSLQLEIQKSATDHELMKASIRLQQQERSLLGERSAIGLMSPATKKTTTRVYNISTVEGYEHELQSTSDSNIDETDQVNMVNRGKQGNIRIVQKEATMTATIQRFMFVCYVDLKITRIPGVDTSRKMLEKPNAGHVQAKIIRHEIITE